MQQINWEYSAKNVYIEKINTFSYVQNKLFQTTAFSQKSYI